MENPRILRNFAIGAAIIMLVVVGYGLGSPVLAIASAAGWLILMWSFPRLNQNLYVRWMHFAEVWGTWNTRILLTIVFYGTCLPIGLFRRIFNRDSTRFTMEKRTRDLSRA